MIFGKDKKLVATLRNVINEYKTENESLKNQLKSSQNIIKSLEEEVDSLRDVAYTTVKIPRKTKKTTK